MGKYMKQLFKRNVFLLITLVYTIFCVVFVGFQIKARNESDPVTAVVNYVKCNNRTGDDKRYWTYITYSYKGEVYRDVHYATGGRRPKVREGHAIKIYVNREQPRKITTGEPVILIGTLLFFEVALILAVVMEKRAWKSASVE